MNRCEVQLQQEMQTSQKKKKNSYHPEPHNCTEEKQTLEQGKGAEDYYKKLFYHNIRYKCISSRARQIH